MTRLAEKTPEAENVHCEFHGGEPFLAPVDTMYRVWSETKDLWASTSWAITTNLTFKITDEILAFIEGPLESRVGTSWDPNIRFATEKQLALWERNVRMLVGRGVQVMVFVSLTKAVIDMQPSEVYDYMKSLGIHELVFERLTLNGSARKHPDIFPTNLEQDEWFVRMYEQFDIDKYSFTNVFLNDVLLKFDNQYMRSGTFCRDCESKLFTINATGTISGCPNSAPEQAFGKLDDTIDSLLFSPNRIESIACERTINTTCYECDVYGFCGGDCHQLTWDGDVCGSPKTLMRQLKSTSPAAKHKVFLLKEV
jgi:radical SAM protein with 4Fe4S-binding SPASM domain